MIFLGCQSRVNSLIQKYLAIMKYSQIHTVFLFILSITALCTFAVPSPTNGEGNAVTNRFSDINMDAQLNIFARLPFEEMKALVRAYPDIEEIDGVSDILRAEGDVVKAWEMSGSYLLFKLIPIKSIPGILRRYAIAKNEDLVGRMVQYDSVDENLLEYPIRRGLQLGQDVNWMRNYSPRLQTVTIIKKNENLDLKDIYNIVGPNTAGSSDNARDLKRALALIEGGLDVNSYLGFSRTPLLFLAINSCKLKIAKALLDAGADINASSGGRTALTFAMNAEKCRERALEMVRGYGAQN